MHLGVLANCPQARSGERQNSLVPLKRCFIWGITLSCLVQVCPGCREDPKLSSRSTGHALPQDEVETKARREHRDSLRIQVPRLPRRLNPLLGSADRWAHTISFGGIYEALLRRVGSDRYAGWLAQDWHVLEQGRRYRFGLRRGVRFHDGVLLSAKDVVFTIRALLGSPTPNELLALSLRDVSEVLAIDAHTVELRLRRPNYLLSAALARTVILPAHVYGKRPLRAWGHKPWIGTGPYAVDAGRSRGKRLVVVCSEQYWGRKPALRQLQYREIGDPARALSALRNAEIDVLSVLHPQYYPRQVNSERFKRRFRVVRVPLPGVAIIVLNAKRRPLKTRRRRLALSLALDRGALAERLPGQTGRPAVWLWGPDSEWNDPRARTDSYDPDLAARLLVADGWTRRGKQVTRRRLGHPLALALIRSTASWAQHVAATLREQLRRAGYRITVAGSDFGYLKAQLARHRFDLALVGLSLPPEGDLSPYLHSEGVLNVGGYKNPYVDILLGGLRRAPTREQRRILARRLHRVLGDDPAVAVVLRREEYLIARRGKLPRSPIAGLGPVLRGGGRGDGPAAALFRASAR